MKFQAWFSLEKKSKCHQHLLHFKSQNLLLAKGCCNFCHLYIYIYINNLSLILIYHVKNNGSILVQNVTLEIYTNSSSYPPI